MGEEQETAPQTLEEFLEQLNEEYGQTQTELKEIDVLIKQSSDEVDKLAQRNAQIANKLRQVEANIDTYPRHDIKSIYTAAQEAQMRLFMMRGQLEQLESKRQNLHKYVQQLQAFLSFSGQLDALGLSSTAAAEGGIPTSQHTIVRIVEAQEDERQHLARQMHDGPAQSLTNLILQAEICERLFDTNPDQARVELNNLKNAVTATFQKTRDFIFDLRPMMLDDLGLVPTLKRYTKDFEEKSNISTNVNVMGKDSRLPAHVEVTIFRIIQALLNNARQHAHASRVQVNVDLQPNAVSASIEDDGSGFNVEEVLASAEQRRTLGIATMKERVEMLGGTLQFESSIGRGTRVRLNIPLEQYE
jgi:two-component system sensor histidine kinase DegS